MPVRLPDRIQSQVFIKRYEVALAWLSVTTGTRAGIAAPLPLCFMSGRRGRKEQQAVLDDRPERVRTSIQYMLNTAGRPPKRGLMRLWPCGVPGEKEGASRSSSFVLFCLFVERCAS